MNTFRKRHMRLFNKRITVNCSSSTPLYENEAVRRVIEQPDILRWAVVSVKKNRITIEATVCDGLRPWNSDLEISARQISPNSKDVVISLVPTGIGCSIGGFAGDAAPITRLLSSTADFLITNPNSVNASHYISLSRNTVYTEGAVIDGFLEGRFPLWIPERNRIGVIIEPTSKANEELLVNVVNAVRAVHGIDIVAIEVADRPFGVRIERNESGAYVGNITNPTSILDAAQVLIRKGATAIAVTSHLEDLPELDYREHFMGNSPNPVGGVEAIISHLIVRALNVPAAHGPLSNYYGQDSNRLIADARGAAEVASQTGLGCVLIGLNQAPQILKPKTCRGYITLENVRAVIAPKSAFGGAGMMAAARSGLRCIAVEDNETILNMHPEKLGISGYVLAKSYLEAVGIIAADREGLSIESLQRPLSTLVPEREVLSRCTGFSDKVAVGIN
jgi:hypothetical protein